MFQFLNAVLTSLLPTMPSEEKVATGTQFLFEEITAPVIRKNLAFQTRCAVLVPALFRFKSLLPRTYILPHPTFIANNPICSHYFSLLRYQTTYSLCLQNGHFWVLSWNPVYKPSLSFSSQVESKKRWWRKGQIWRADDPWPFFCNCCILMGLPSVRMDTGLWTMMLVFSYLYYKWVQNICHFNCCIQLASSCHPTTD